MGLCQHLGLWGGCLFLHGVGSAGDSTILKKSPKEKRTFFRCKISLLKYLSLSEFSKTKENQPWIFIRRTDAEAEAPILTTWCEEPTHWKRPWCCERLRAGRKGDDRGWDGWMISPIQWTWKKQLCELVMDREALCAVFMRSQWVRPDQHLNSNNQSFLPTSPKFN